MSKNELVMRPVKPGTTLPVPDRATRAAAWVGWHLFEITGVTVPAVVAVSVTPWWWLVSGVVGAGWTANEVRVARKNTAIRAGRDQVVAVATSEKPDETSGVDGHSVDGHGVGGVR
jgi:hypothetical protein